MKKSKKRAAVLLLQILAVLLIIVIIGYFIYLFSVAVADGKQQSDYSGKIYASSDQQIILDFDESAEHATLRLEGVNGFKTSLSLDFEDNIFTATNGDTVYYFMVINDTTLYYSEGNYLFLATYE